MLARAALLYALLVVPPAAAAASAPDRPALAAAVAALERSDPDPAALDPLFAQLQAADDPALLARAHLFRCQRLLFADPAQARRHADLGLAVDAPRALAERAGLHACRGYLADSGGRPEDAVADYDRAIELARQGADTSTLAQSLVLRGELLHARGQYAAALEDMQTAFALYTELGNTRQQRYTLNAIANLYADEHVGQPRSALDYYRRLLAMHRDEGNALEAANVLFNIASTLERLGELPQAVASFEQALQQFEQLDDADSMAQTRRALAAVLLQQGDSGRALQLLEPAYRQAQQSDDADLLARIALTRGAARWRHGEIEAALVDLQQAADHFERVDNPRFLERIERERADALAAAGRWQQAHAARLRQLALEQRLVQQRNDELSSRLRIQFDSERKEEENRALQRENELRAQALADGERIRDLQTLVLALAALLIALLGLTAARALLRARHLRRLALTDELTQLPNRRSILASLDEQRRRDPACGVLLCDIDHFKSINDRFGHEIGDQVLQRVARRGQAALAREGVFGRLGGEEFLAVLRVPGADQAALAERLRAAIEAGDDGDLAPGLRVTISIGGARLQPADQRLEDAIMRADAALYRAKAGGRNQVQWSAPD